MPTVSDIPGLAKLIYDAYPGADLLGIDPPTSSTTMADFCRDDVYPRADNCGDGLFSFLVSELGETGLSLDDCVNRLHTIASDIAAITRAFCAIRNAAAKDGGA